MRVIQPLFKFLWDDCDLTPLSSLPNLRYLDLQATGVAKVAALSSVTSLQELRLGQNAISDLTPLNALVNLQTLDLGDNDVVDVTPLSSLANLTWLNLSYNPITTLESFVSGAIFSGAEAGDTLLAHGNPFVQAVCDLQIPALEARGTDVTYTPCGEPVDVSACYTPVDTTVDAACSTSPSSDPIVAFHWTVTYCLEGRECYVYTNDAGPTPDLSSLCNPQDWAKVELTIETASGCRREYSGPFFRGNDRKPLNKNSVREGGEGVGTGFAKRLGWEQQYADGGSDEKLQYWKWSWNGESNPGPRHYE